MAGQKDDLSELERMIYSGRGITVGMTPSGLYAVGYSLTGRSPPSQARELIAGKDTHTIRTSAITENERLKKMFGIEDEAKLAELKKQIEGGSPALTIYPALAHAEDMGSHALVASNGVQTNLLYSTAMRAMRSPATYARTILEEAFRFPSFVYDPKDDRWIDITSFEPDSPNNTPRISACVYDGRGAMHIVWCEEGQKSSMIYSFPLAEGRGKLITTYFGKNEKPLRPFEGAPKDVAIASESAAEFAESIYAAVAGGAKPEDNYRVAAAAMTLEPKTGELDTAIINRIERGE